MQTTFRVSTYTGDLQSIATVIYEAASAQEALTFVERVKAGSGPWSYAGVAGAYISGDGADAGRRILWAEAVSIIRL